MSAYNGVRGFGLAPWDEPDTSAADEARELAETALAELQQAASEAP